jgi:hypothetical protein
MNGRQGGNWTCSQVWCCVEGCLYRKEGLRTVRVVCVREHDCFGLRSTQVYFRVTEVDGIYDRQSVGQSVLVSGALLGPTTNFSFSLKFPLDSCGFVILYHPLWREAGFVIYSTIASWPCQSSHSWIEVPQNSRPYFTVSSETPPTWRTRSPYFLSPGNRVAQLYPRALGWLPLFG